MIVSCVQLQDDCNYSQERDARRAAGRDYVTGLEERIRLLERLLEETIGKSRLDNAGVGTSQGEDVRDQDEIATLGLDRLRVSSEKYIERDATGLTVFQFDPESHELHQYGPTSAYQHLAEDHPAPHAAVSPDILFHESYREGAPTLLSSGPFAWERHLAPNIDMRWDQALHDQLINSCFSAFRYVPLA